MIITRTPLRISFAGGGTDLPGFYRRYGGAVVSMAIDKYIYVTVNEKFDGRIRLSYSQTENVDNADELQHDLVRELLKLMKMDGVEITMVSDIPGSGTGLGSSSALLVGLALALSTYRQNAWCKKHLAETAFTVEHDFCKHVLGKQDHYAATYGGLHYYKFDKDGRVGIHPIYFEPEERKYFMDRLILFWTGQTRSASTILAQQDRNISRKGEAQYAGERLRDLADLLNLLLVTKDFEMVGYILHTGWYWKKKMAESISSPWLDEIYQKGTDAGAKGGKLLGAGGGGFMLFWVEPELRQKVIDAVQLRQVPFEFDDSGSTVIYDGRKG